MTAPETPTLDPRQAAAIARRAIPLLDLTDLSETCDARAIDDLCATARAAGVAAICVWPRFVAQARRALGESPVRLATVVNFPEGGEDGAAARAETRAAIAEGADEIDVVMPYRALMRGDVGGAQAVLAATREACGAHPLKVILESGTLGTPERVAAASALALRAGADFLKTSTGKAGTGATPDAVETMLAAIRADGAEPSAGLKVSGGLRRLEDAARYLALVDARMGADWACARTLRLGASSLYGELARALEVRP